MITNQKVRDIEKLHELSRSMTDHDLYKKNSEEYQKLSNKFLGIDIVGILLDEIKFLEKVRSAQQITIQELSVYKWKYDELSK